jgi:succinyl-diaminopimelate desuccinylase
MPDHIDPPDPERLERTLVQLTRDLILIESTDARPEERKRCFQFVRNHLEAIPDVELQRFEDGGYESLVVLPSGCTRPEVLFSGHLDVVEHPDSGAYRSDVRDGRIHGPGAGDMKGQLAILIQLVRHLWRVRPGLPIGLAITSDEERGGEHGVRFLVEEAGVDAGVVVMPDGGSLADITVAEKGILHLRLRSGGTAAHAARPWLGVNALEGLIDDIQQVRKGFFDPLRPSHVDPDDLDTHWFATCSVTMGGTLNDSPNRIPESAEAVLDIRFPPPWNSHTILEEISSRLGLGTAAEVIISAEPTNLSPDPRFVQVTADVTGLTPRMVRASGGSDARFFCLRGVPVLLSRPLVGNLHGTHEWIDIRSMLDYFEICRRYTLERCESASEHT